MTGFVLWFTGLSGSGKSTLTSLVSAELRRRGLHVETLDGDEVRQNLSKGLGFSKDDRDANVRRLGFVARLISRSGGCAITAAISPYREVREEVRRGVERFCEVYCECPMTVLAQRDPKGLYEKALRGEIKNFTGVDDPYEAPLAPEVHLRTDLEDPVASAARIVERIVELGFVGAGSGGSPGLGVPPYGDDLRVAPVASPERRMERSQRLQLDRDAEQTVVGLALGLFSPVRGFMGSREAFKVEHEQHLERGLPWPAPLVLPTPEPTAGLVSLVSTDDQELASLQVGESWSEMGDGRRLLAGDITVTGRPPWASRCRDAAEIRASLTDRRSCVAFPLFGAPTLGDEYLARAALERGEHLILMPLVERARGAAVVRACEALVSRYFDGARVSVEPIPAPPFGERTLGDFLAVFAQNLGAVRIMLPEHHWVTSDAPERAKLEAALTIRVEPYPDPYFDETVGGIITRRSGPPPEATQSAKQRALALRPEVSLAAQRGD